MGTRAAGWLRGGEGNGTRPRMVVPSLLDRERAVLVVIDVQAAYRPVLHEWARVERNCALAVRGSSLLGIPVIVTEQYPRGLGRTVDEIARSLPADAPVIEKLSMSCCGAAAFLDRLTATGRSQVLVTGIETHACVNQTVLELRGRGYEVHVARDATSSRFERLVQPAWERMMAAGALPTTVEQALLEAVRTAAVPEFRSLQRLLKGAAGP